MPLTQPQWSWLGLNFGHSSWSQFIRVRKAVEHGGLVEVQGQSRGQILALPLISYVTSGQLLNFVASSISSTVEQAITNRIYFTELL